MTEIRPPYLTGLTAPTALPDDWIMSDNGSARQAKLCYLSFYCRTGGVDWPLLKQNYDAVVIRAGQGGYGYDELLHEHVDLANQYGVPYMTSWQSDRRQDMRAQGYFYADGYGVKGHRASIAHEYTGSGLATPDQALLINQVVAEGLGEKPLNYSRQNIIFDDWDWPAWLEHYEWEIARYPLTYDVETEKYIQYDTADRFLAERAQTYPKDLPVEFEEITRFWQFADKTDARATFASARTDDPYYSSGLLSGTASVGLNENYLETIEWLGGELPTTPPVEPPPPSGILFRVRVKTKWNLRAEPRADYWNAKDLGDVIPPLELCVFEEVTDSKGYTWYRFGGDNCWGRSDGMEII